jgi:PAS domain S-box-containing protein
LKSQIRSANLEVPRLSGDALRAPLASADDLSDRQIDRLIDANVSGVMIADAAGNVYEANDALLEMHGYTRDDTIAKEVNWLSLTPANWKPHAAEFAARFFQHGFGSFQMEHFHRDGHRIPLSLGATRIRGTDLALCTLVDLSSPAPGRTINPQAAFFAAQKRFGLTSREHEVLSYLLEGLTNAEIAAVLLVSAATVTDHVKSIMRKVGVRNRGKLFKRVILE